MSLSPHTTKQALAVARAEHDHRSRDWTGLCQMFVRRCYGVGPLFGSARAQWLGCDPEDRHPGGHPADAPLGSLLCFAGGSKGFGHIELAARDLPSGAPGAWSNDLLRGRVGFIDKVHRDAPITKWGQTYSGFITAVNDVDLRMPQKTHYAAIQTAINRLGAARDTARAQSDAADVKVLDAEIVRLQGLYDTLRRHA
jgi:hypothetical protein